MMLLTCTAAINYAIRTALTLAVVVFAQTAWSQIPSPTIQIKPPIDNDKNPHAAHYRERDTDKDGMLNETEYVIGAGRDRKMVRREFKVFDADRDGRLNLNEFLTVPVGQPEDQRGVIDDPVVQLAAKRLNELMARWKAWDANADGSLSNPEFQSAKIGVFVPGLESASFADWDQDVDGKISRDDVRRALEVAYGVTTSGGAMLRNNAGLVVDWLTFSRLKIGDDGMVSKEDYFEALGAAENKDGWLNSIDKNHDGRFDFAEFSTGNHRTDPVGSFLAQDKDFDGLLSLEELQSLPEWWRQMATFSFKGFDDDHDGAISLREYQLMPHCNLLAAWTEVVDQDYDGKLTDLRVGSGLYLSALAAEYFRRLDIDGDRALSSNEFQFVSSFKPIRTIEGWGALEDPRGTTTVELKDGVLSMKCPGLLVDNYPPGAVNAPRVTQEVTGDFTVEVKVTRIDEAIENSVLKEIVGFAAYHAATLLVRLDEKNCIRLERVSMHKGANLFTLCVLQVWENGETVAYNSNSVENVVTNLLLERQGNLLLSSYSQDGGKSWTELPQHQLKTLAGKVRVGVSMTNNTDPGSTVEFRNFELVKMN